MRYSEIEKCCNFSRPKTPFFHAGLITALLRLNRSSSRGCSCGSTSRWKQTLPSNEVCRLRTPTCLCATNPPFLQDRTWSYHYKHASDRGSLHLKRRESLNSCLFSSTKPRSTRGAAVFHELASLSFGCLTDHTRSEGRVESTLSILDFANAMNVLCAVIESTCDAVIVVEVANYSVWSFKP